MNWNVFFIVLCMYGVWWCLSSSTIFILLAMAIWDSFFSFISTKNKKHHQQHKQTKYSQNTFKLRIRKILYKFFFKKRKNFFLQFSFFPILLFVASFVSPSTFLRKFICICVMNEKSVFVFWTKNLFSYICGHVTHHLYYFIIVVLLFKIYNISRFFIDMNREKKIIKWNENLVE